MFSWVIYLALFMSTLCGEDFLHRMACVGYATRRTNRTTWEFSATVKAAWQSRQSVK